MKLVPPMLKRQRTQQIMTKNGLDIHIILTRRTDFQTDLVLQFGQEAEKNEKADPSQNKKSAIFANATNNNKITNTINLLKTNVQYIAPLNLRFITLTH